MSYQDFYRRYIQAEFRENYNEALFPGKIFFGPFKVKKKLAWKWMIRKFTVKLPEA